VEFTLLKFLEQIEKQLEQVAKGSSKKAAGARGVTGQVNRILGKRGKNALIRTRLRFELVHDIASVTNNFD